MLSLSDNNLVTTTEAFKSTSKYRRLSNIDNPYFEQMVSQIYPTDIQLHKAFLYCGSLFELVYFYNNGIVLSKIYDKRDDFYFEIVNFHSSIWSYSSLHFFWFILQLIRFAGKYFQMK